MANSDAAQSTESSGLTAFTTGGFTVGTDQDINNSGELTLAFGLPLLLAQQTITAVLNPHECFHG